MNKRFYRVFNYSSLVVVAVLILLIALKAVSPAVTYYLLIFMILIFLLRITFRVLILVQERKAK